MTKPRPRATASRDPNALVPHGTVLALDPEALHAQAEASVRALLKDGESLNTQRSYAAALRYWAAWFRLRYRSALALPVPVPAVLQFLVDHVERTTTPAGGGPSDAALAHDLPPAIDAALVAGGFKGARGAPALNTVMHRLSVLSKAHQLRELPNPTRDPTVQELVSRIRRAYAARGAVSARKPALTKDPLQAMLATCTDGLVGLRDRAALLFAFASGGRRRSEVAAAVMENLVKVDAQTYVYRLTHSKTDQAGTDHNANAQKPIVGPAAEALTAWLEASGVTSGAIFRRVRKTKACEPLASQALWHIVKRRATLAGLEGDYGAHSLRSGFVTEAGRQNVPLGDGMALTGHRSVAMFLRYFQAGAVQHGPGANLFSDANTSTSQAAMLAGRSVPLHDPNRRPQDVKPYLPNCSVPLLFEGDVPEAPYGLAGTGFLLRWNNRVYFTAAKHSLRPGDHNRLRVPATFRSPDMLVLNEFADTTLLDTDGDDDCSDFVLFSVEPVDFGPRDARNLEPVDVAIWDTMSVFRQDTLLTVRGYPQSAPRSGIDYDRRVITVQAATCEAMFQGAAESKFCFKLQFTEPCPLTDFNHMSGSPVFAETRDGHSAGRLYVLVGLLLRAGGPDRLGRFVSIECVKEGLRQFDAEHALLSK